MSSSRTTSTLASLEQVPLELNSLEFSEIELGEIDLTEFDLLADLDPGMIAWGAP
jgi:hypothetical protein